MARLRRTVTQGPVADDASLRLRASWLYHSDGLTQKDISERLGISRGTVIRLLAEAVERGEVQIWIAEGDGDCIELALKLEDAFGLDEAIVVPSASAADQATKSIGLALGRFLSEVVADGMTLGVGWGRTLMASLASLRPLRHEGVKVVSLVGGMVRAEGSNPLEYSWRVASQFGAQCFLFIAPAFVDSPATKARLIDKCGLDELVRLSRSLDLAVFAAGDIGARSTSQAASMLTAKEIEELVALGCVGDVLCNFLDAEGRSDLDDLRKAGHVVIACGGMHRAAAIRAAIRRIGCNTLITDEGAARALLAAGR